MKITRKSPFTGKVRTKELPITKFDYKHLKYLFCSSISKNVSLSKCRVSSPHTCNPIYKDVVMKFDQAKRVKIADCMIKTNISYMYFLSVNHFKISETENNTVWPKSTETL